MTTSELRKLRNSLPKGWAAKLAATTEFSKVYVWQVMNGKERNNMKIIDAAIDLAREFKEENTARKNAIATF